MELEINFPEEKPGWGVLDTLPTSPVGPLEEALLPEIHQDASEPMNEVDVQILAYVLQRYPLSGTIPTPEKIALACGVSRQVAACAFKKSEFQARLTNLGITETEADLALSPEQIRVVNAIMNVHDKASLREKLKDAGVSTQKFNNWKAQPAFQKYMRERAEKQFGDVDVDIRLAVIKGVQSNDLGFVKLAGEMTGVYNPKVQVELNVTLVLTRVVEILTKYVDGPTLLAVSEELEKLSPTSLQIGA